MASIIIAHDTACYKRILNTQGLRTGPFKKPPQTFQYSSGVGPFAETDLHKDVNEVTLPLLKQNCTEAELVSDQEKRKK